MIFYGSCDKNITSDFANALKNPLSPDGGLYCPSELKKFNINELKDLDFSEFAKKIYESFNVNISMDLFLNSLDAYLEFDTKEPFVIRKLDNNTDICELFHGKTRAFKDLALAPLARLLKDEKQLIMCATSGDTGPATLSAFSKNPKTKVVCIYPKGKTSVVQERQMANVDYGNSLVLAIDGNFDDAQTKLKELLNDEEFKNIIKKSGYELSAANSLNFGRIMYQLMYHFYLSLKYDEKINVVVPSGNFGNALACFYAKQMGANIDKIKIVSNENTILYDFFTTGEYDLRSREFKCTYSPAMDILKSSNLERLIFYFFGDIRTKELFTNLKNNKYFKISKDELSKLQEHFIAYKCSDSECLANIKKYSDKYLLDPHTATTINALDKGFHVICSTAEWSKFTPSINKALGIFKDELTSIKDYAKKYNYKLNENLLNALNSSTYYAKDIKVDEIKNTIIEWIKQ